jgi:hypothetical protein
MMLKQFTGCRVTYLMTLYQLQGRISQSVQSLGLGMDSQGIGDQFPGETRDISLVQIAHTECGAQSVSYKIGPVRFFSEGKADGA